MHEFSDKKNKRKKLKKKTEKKKRSNVTCDTFITHAYWYYVVIIKNTNDANR